MNAEQIEAAVDGALARHGQRDGGLLPVLHDVQDTIGHIPASAVGRIAQAMNLSRAEVHGVVTFYHHFRTQPAGRHVVRVCQAEACQSMGAERLSQHVQSALGCAMHETSADGAFTLEPVYCLGLCAMSPSASIDDEVHARLTPESFDRLIAGMRRGDVAGTELP